MDDEHAEGKSSNTWLMIGGLLAGGISLAVGGGIGIVAGILAGVCLVRGVADTLITPESPCEQFYRECGEADAAIASLQPDVAQAQEAGNISNQESRRWRQATETNKKSGRCR